LILILIPLAFHIDYAIIITPLRHYYWYWYYPLIIDYIDYWYTADIIDIDIITPLTLLLILLLLAYITPLLLLRWYITLIRHWCRHWLRAIAIIDITPLRWYAIDYWYYCHYWLLTLRHYWYYYYWYWAIDIIE
jgi:hypothetical protein